MKIQGVKEPAEGGEPEIVSTYSAVEMASGGVGDPGSAIGDAFTFVIKPVMTGDGANQDQTIVIMPKGPGELEERVDENCDQQQHLQIPKDGRRLRGEGQFAKHHHRLFTPRPGQPPGLR